MGPHIAVLIAAAGTGKRLGGMPKQFRSLGRRPLLVQTALAFERHGRVSSIIVIAPAADVDRVRSLLGAAEFPKLHDVVAGGSSRTESVARGLAAIPLKADVVLVHDAARPFVAPGAIDAVIDAAKLYGAASLAIEVEDTLRRRNGGQLGEPIDRSGALRVQTPQGFRADLLRRAHAVAERAQYNATDDASLVIAAGSPVTVVPGSSFNLKITTPEDWHLARAIWPRWKKMWNLD